MPASPPTKDEAARLAILHAYAILDTPPEEAFDDIARVAAHVTGMPIALVSLVDAQRQWFKAKVGLADEETSREVSFCAHAIHEPALPCIVENPRADPRFADNPDVLGGLGIRYYAGVPLVSSAGPAVGTLCVIDRTPNRLSVAQIETLQALARQVVRLLETRRAARELDEARRLLASQARALALHDLVMGVAHEVGNPLTSMRIAAARLAEEVERLRVTTPSASVDTAARCARTLGTGVERLSGLAHALRRITEASTEPTSEVTIERLVAMAVEEAGPGAIPVALEMATEATIRGRCHELAKALASLLDNARDAMRGSSQAVRVRASADGFHARLEVRDDGCGIAPEHADRMFTPFFTTKPDGTGIALAIARRTIEDHGGRVTFESEPGRGTVFHVELPLRRDG
ncbi:MAG TPA: GAF domain-containing sensor histidine kinase [Candidatus Thermoplasmatota archaeon]|nr:GAF domain-containing sensor histidine kinase [Candidatus Thermoplasmatota archaeon]